MNPNNKTPESMGEYMQLSDAEKLALMTPPNTPTPTEIPSVPIGASSRVAAVHAMGFHDSGCNPAHTVPFDHALILAHDADKLDLLLENTGKANEQLREQNRELRIRTNELASQLSATVAQQIKDNSDAHDTEQRCNRVERELAEAKELNAGQSVSIANLTSNIEVAHHENIRLKAELDDVRANLAQCEEDKDWNAEELKDEIARLKAELDKCNQHWDSDITDEFTGRINSAHPVMSDDPKAGERYGIAMQMVGNRHSEHALVAMACWLLSERDQYHKAADDLSQCLQFFRMTGTWTARHDDALAAFRKLEEGK